MSRFPSLLHATRRLTALPEASTGNVATKVSRWRTSMQGYVTSTESAANKAKEAASDVANKASTTASKAGEAVNASQSGAADASHKAQDAASSLGQKAKDAVAGAGQKVQGAAGEAKGAAQEYASKAHGAAGDAASAAAGAGQKAGQHASAAAGAAGGAAKTKAGGVPLLGLAAVGIAGGAAIYHGFKKSPGSHGDKFVSQKAEDTHGAVEPAASSTIAAFTVTGADGKPVTLDDFKGDFALLAFGKAKDKELSESKLMRLRDVIAESDKRSNMQYTKAAFVSEDPDNDKPEMLAKLLDSVNAVGKKTEQCVMALTGPQVDKIKRAAHVLTARAGKEGKPQLAPGTDSSLYLVSPECEVVVIFEDKATVDEVGDAVAKQILNYGRIHGSWHTTKSSKPRHA